VNSLQINSGIDLDMDQIERLPLLAVCQTTMALRLTETERTSPDCYSLAVFVMRWRRPDRLHDACAWPRPDFSAPYGSCEDANLLPSRAGRSMIEGVVGGRGHPAQK
jgi:hypothetical protein